MAGRPLNAPRARLRCAWLLVLGAVVLASTPPVLAQGPSTAGLVARDEHLSARALERVLEALLGEDPAQAPSPTLTTLDDPGLLRALQRRLIPVRTLQEQEEGGCRDDAIPFPTLVEQAGEALDFLEQDRAVALLEQARRGVTCEVQVLQPRVLGRFMFLRGVLEAQWGRDPTLIFTDALAIDPGLSDPADHAPAVRRAFAAARRALPSRPPVRLRADAALVGGLSLSVDGVMRDSSVPLMLRAGQHFVQLVDSQGRAAAGAVLQVVPDDAGVPWPPAGLRPPSAEDVRSRLAQSTRSGEWSEAFQMAFREYLERTGTRWLAVVVSGDEEGQVFVGRISSQGLPRFFAVETQGHRRATDPEAFDEGTGRRSPWRRRSEWESDPPEGAGASRAVLGNLAAWLGDAAGSAGRWIRGGGAYTIGFGTCAVVSSALYGQTWSRLGQEVFHDAAEAAGVVRVGRAAGTVGVLSVLGMGASIGWQVWQGQAQGASATQREAIGASARVSGPRIGAGSWQLEVAPEHVGLRVRF